MHKITSANLHSVISEAYKLRDKKESARALELAQACLKSFPKEAKIHALVGVILFDEKKIIEAISSLQTAISLAPSNAEFHLILGQIERAAGRLPEASLALNKCLKLDPNNAKAHYNMGLIYHVQNKLTEAITEYEKALSAGPDINIFANLGAVHTKDRQFSKAIAYYEKALAIDPHSVSVLANFAGTYIEMGDLKKAEHYLRQALSISPHAASYWRNLTLCCDYQSENNADIIQIQENLNNPSSTEQDKIHYYFSLGNIFDKLKQYEKAMGFYQKANELKAKTIDFDSEAFASHIKQVINFFSEETLLIEESSTTMPEPLFIVGMPRAGKSLLETLLSSHPLIYAAGEVGIVEFVQDYPFFLKNTTKDQISAIRNAYFERLKRDVNKPNCRYIIDTLPGNFMYFGLLHLLFPKAKLIVCQRDAFDVGLAIYFKYFVEGHGYSYDLKKIGYFYKQYQKMISFWKEKYPEFILEIQYKELVHYPKKIINLLLNHLQLNNDVPLDVSNIHSDKVGYSHHYEQYLSPLKEIILSKHFYLTDAQEDILFEPFQVKPKLLEINETRLLVEGNVSKDNTSDSFMTESWDQYFSDLSSGSYQTIQSGEKHVWRMRTWHFLYKNLALVDALLHDSSPILRVLDIGCSSGYLRRFIEGNIDFRRVNKIYYWGIDIRRSMLEKAVNAVDDIESGAKGNLTPSLFLHHDIKFGLPFKENSFDYIVNFELIKYLPLPQGEMLIKEMKRILKPSGTLYLSTTYQPDRPGYMQSVPFKRLEEILVENGFSIIERRGSQSSIQFLAPHLKPEHVELVKDLLKVHPAEMVGAMITPLYPYLSQQVTFICKIT